ncbi:uncharacterized protein UTRI_04272 [Ustilago trichophora]|uniref:Uncharacterized protein n=1 Tax=Ustilago trichophora TaxID=86804 RepID=A0A5C3EPR2_9BASI|nr:uncharacterized protein UTRI_04272 [Ustilago trichophora]
MRTCQNSQLWASSEAGRVKFPAFVHLPASALPHSRHSLCENDEDFVKCITIDAVYNSFLARGRRDNFKQLLAQRWRISEDQIRAITVNIEGIRVLIENDQDWQEWVSTFFFRAHPTSSTTRESDRAPFIEFRIEPIHIHIIVDDEMLFSATPAGPSAGVGTANAPPTYSEVTTRNSASNAPPTAQDLISQLTRLNADVRAYHQASRSADAAATPSEPTVQQQQQQPQPQPQPQPTTSQPRAQVPQPQLIHNTSSANLTAPPAQSSFSEPLTASTLATNIVGSVLHTLQPQLMQGLAPAITSILSNLPIHLTNASAQSRGADPATTALGSGVAESLPTPSAASTRATATSESSTQRQSLMQGMFDELSRLRNPSASTSTSASQQPRSATSHDADLGITGQETDEGMTNELGQAFAEMLARQRVTSTNANTAASTTTHVDESQDLESPTIVSTPSSTTPSRRSSGSRSRSRSRSPRRTTFLSTTTLTLLTLLSFFLALVTPTCATPSASPSPSSLSLTSLNPTFYTRDTVAPRQNSRHLHLCKCTCFQTNSTLVPLYSPLDPSKPCSTCTRQFCLDQGLDMCKGAKLEHTDHDVGTGFEGDVWAKCFERDSYKDQSIITLYLLVVVGLVGFAAMRRRVEGWVQRYQHMGPHGLYSAVREAPWRRAR